MSLSLCLAPVLLWFDKPKNSELLDKYNLLSSLSLTHPLLILYLFRLMLLCPSSVVFYVFLTFLFFHFDVNPPLCSFLSVSSSQVLTELHPAPVTDAVVSGVPTDFYPA